MWDYPVRLIRMTMYNNFSHNQTVGYMRKFNEFDGSESIVK